MTLSRPVAIAASALALVGLLAVASVAVAAQGAVSIVDKTFSPADLTVNAGDTVVWTVTKAFSQPHSVTSGASGDPDSGKLFDSGIKLTNNGDTFSQTFATAGTFPYYCQVHPTEMKGTITVLAAGGGSAPPTASQPPTASAAPGASLTPGASAAPGASESPAASEIPGSGSEHPPISTTEKLIAAGIVVAVLVVLFGAAWYYRRVNR